MTRRPRYWRLDGKLAVPATMHEWARSFEDFSKRQVGDTKIGPIRISTVFLGLDHNFAAVGDPLIFETMIFRGGEGNEMFRCSTWQEAKEQHARAVAKVRAEIKENAK